MCRAIRHPPLQCRARDGGYPAILGLYEFQRGHVPASLQITIDGAN